MAHKKGRGRGDSSDPDDLSRTPLQAVLLADSFATKFRPITLERPKVLLPLVNVPMIEYTLAWLESVGVEEVFVFSCANSGQVKAYLNGSDWTKSSEVFSVKVIESNDAMSVGDALRAIYSHSVIHGDFILVSGDTVSNMSLTQALQKHKERRKKDPLSIMTMVIKHSKPSSLAHQTRLGTDEIVMAIDPETQELLYYEDKADSSEWSISLDKMLLADKPALYLLNDMQDCYIDICSPEVLSLFTDNFDYQHLRRHFVKGLLVDDIMGYKIFTHEIHSSYAARVDSLRSYDTISKDIMQRWTYPFVPDVQYFGNMSQMKLDREGIYKASEVIQSRSARIGPFSLVGNGTTVGDHSCIFNSVIGKGCTVGRNVSIHGSYIWDNVTIEDNCTINYALVCDDVHLSTGVVLEPGVVLSFKVQVGKQFVVPAHSKVSLHPQPAKQDSDEELEYADFNNGVFESPSITSMVKNGNAELTPYALELGTSEVGISGVGYIWAACETGLEEEWRHSIAPIPAEKLKEYFLGLPRGCDESSQDVKPLLALNKLLPDCGSADFDDADDADDDYRDSAHFEEEVDATFRRALNGVDQDNVIIEINSLRLAFNVEYKDCVGALFYSIMKSAYDDSSKDDLLANTSKAIKKWKDLLKNYLKTEDEEIEVIMKFEEMCLESAKGFFPHINSILFCLYENDIVTEDAIFTWANEKEGGDEADKICLKEADKFIAWLRTAEEEEEEEDKDDEEDDEDKDKDKDEDGDDE